MVRRESTIRRFLLFEQGDAYDPELLDAAGDWRSRMDLVAHTGASSNPCRARKGALKGSRLERAASAGRGMRLGVGVELVALPGPSWNQIQDWLTQLGRLKVDLESRVPGAP